SDADGAIHKISYQTPVGVIVANGQPGYSETGNWYTESVGTDYGGTDRYASASGNGNNIASWQATGLSPGAYTVQATWPSFFNQAILLGSEAISAAADLAAGNHAGTSPAFQINANGSYYLFAKLNANSAFAEIDSTNNLTVTAATTSVTGPAASNPVIIANGQ